MIKSLIGTSIKNIRVCDCNGVVIPFQIDEITDDGEYVCDAGKEPNENSGNGILDPQDEIAFMWEDVDSSDSNLFQKTSKSAILTLKLRDITKRVVIVSDSTLKLSKKRYIQYDHERQFLRTPYFYAQFGKNRFHFTKAGVWDFESGGYVDMTNELRIEILLRAFWGLIPIRYTEENMICLVKRYKAGPIRLIRRGDFHLNMGLGLKGSRAVVNQICYPQLVKVPVFIHVPVRFKTLFSEAYFEMSPVVRSDATGFLYRIPDAGFKQVIDGKKADTLIRVLPNGKFWAVSDGKKGFGWVLKADIPDSLFNGSGFIFRKPSVRKAFADCGFRLTLRDLAKGYYQITNWVLFSDSYDHLREISLNINKPITISNQDGLTVNNLLSAPIKRSGSSTRR